MFRRCTCVLGRLWEVVVVDGWVGCVWCVCRMGWVGVAGVVVVDGVGVLGGLEKGELN
jgi:hypothetical protein